MSKKFLNAAVIVAAICGLVFLCFQFSLFDTWQEKLFDRFFVKKSASPQIIIFGIDNESIAKLGRWPWDRSVFAAALAKLQTAKTVAIDVNFSEPSSGQGDAQFAAALKNSAATVILPVQINQATQETTRPLEIFGQHSLEGSVNILNEDGVARRVENAQGDMVSFGALAAETQWSGLIVPGQIRIDYAGPEKTFLTLPLPDLLDGKIPERLYTGKLVFIGATAPDLHDAFQTPFGLLPGVEIHANIANTLLGQKFYTPVPPHVSLIIIILCVAAAAWLILTIKKIVWLASGLVGAFTLINIAGIIFFAYKLILPVLYLDIAFLLAAGLLIILQYLTESAEKKFIYESFKYYLSPEVINEIVKDPKKLKLGGEKKKITVFFSDVRGFSSLSEKLSPEILTYVISEYMTIMTDLIMAHKGLVAQYFGDGIMAFWGAPLPNDNQAQDACTCAAAMLPALETLNTRFSQESIPVKINIGIGMNTAQVVAGNIGSKKKFNYTVFGDGVNLTSRLEGLNKEYGTAIIISSATKQEIGENGFYTRELDTIIVKGKKEPTVIFELLTHPLDAQIAKHFAVGREWYEKGEWAKAINEFSAIADRDPPSKLFLARCREFLAHPPANWNGVYEFKTK